MIRKVGQFLASGAAPDHSALKSYARRITQNTAPELSRAIVEGATILGMPVPEAYVSFGELDTGVRGYDGKPPFLLIGSEHLDRSSPHFMATSELMFLIGGECRHDRTRTQLSHRR